MSDTLHELLSALKELAIELGRTPNKEEFCSQFKGGYHRVKLFGGYTALVRAAGLQTYEDRKTKKSSAAEFFRADLETVLNDYEPAEIIAQPKYQKTVVIPDTHFPFVNHRVLESIYKWIEKEKPSLIVQIGDLYDMYAHAKFPRSLNVYTPNQEEDMARKGAEEMWAEINRIVPDAKKVQLKGNHDVRATKRTLEVQPAVERAIQKYVNELMSFPGVTLIEDPRQEYIVDGIEFIHGYRSGIGEHRDFALMNAVCGHIHRGGVTFKRIRGQTLWELNAGLAGDPESKALSYTPQKITHWTPGFGAIDEFGPRFIPV